MHFNLYSHIYQPFNLQQKKSIIYSQLLAWDKYILQTDSTSMKHLNIKWEYTIQRLDALGQLYCHLSCGPCRWTIYSQLKTSPFSWCQLHALKCLVISSDSTWQLRYPCFSPNCQDWIDALLLLLGADFFPLGLGGFSYYGSKLLSSWISAPLFGQKRKEQKQKLGTQIRQF